MYNFLLMVLERVILKNYMNVYYKLKIRYLLMIGGYLHKYI